MRCLKVVGLSLLLTFVIAVSSYAADPPPTSYQVKAEVPGDATFKVELYATKKVGDNWEPDFANPRNTINFGLLQSAGVDPITGESYAMQGQETYCVVVYAANNEMPYHINYEGTDLMYGTATIPRDAYTATLDYHVGISGIPVPIPTGGSFTAGEKKSAVTTSAWRVYSTTTPSYFPFRVYFGITANPDDAVDVDGDGVDLIGVGQEKGTYTGSVTFTFVSD